MPAQTEAGHDKPTHGIVAMCVACQHRWYGLVYLGTSLLGLTCPECGEEQSFATFLPEGYLEAFN